MNMDSKSVPYRLILKQFVLQVGLLLLTVLILFSFQNCSPPIAEDGMGDISSAAQNAPFAYETKVDHVAYMSCAGATNNPAIFTFKAGAFDAGNGHALRPSFLAATANHGAAAKAAILAESPLNKNVNYQIAVRQSANYQLAFGNIFGNFQHNLSAESNALALANAAGSYVNYLSGSNPQGQTNYATYVESQAQAVRDYVGGTGFLGLTYLQPDGDPAYAAGPTVNSTNAIYGTGFLMTFRLPPGFTSGQARVLQQINDANLETVPPTPSANVWDCNNNFVFKIVRAEDRGLFGATSFCNAGPGYIGDNLPASMTAAQTEALATIRKILPESQWGVDLVNKCVVLKTANVSCYGPVSGNIAYNPAVGCNPAANTCPHFVSVCKKR
jgi:hypothetical protein